MDSAPLPRNDRPDSFTTEIFQPSSARGKLSGRRGDANSYSGRQNDQSRSGGTTSGKNLVYVEHQSKNTFDEKHVAHLLHQVFEDDDAGSGDDRNRQRAANEESGFSIEADYRVSSLQMHDRRRILVEATSDDGYNEETSVFPR